jgi:hypothetical protein
MSSRQISSREMSSREMSSSEMSSKELSSREMSSRCNGKKYIRMLGYPISIKKLDDMVSKCTHVQCSAPHLRKKYRFPMRRVMANSLAFQDN